MAKKTKTAPVPKTKKCNRCEQHRPAEEVVHGECACCDYIDRIYGELEEMADRVDAIEGVVPTQIRMALSDALTALNEWDQHHEDD